MPILQDTLTKITSISFANSSDIDNYFIQQYGQDFITWFNAKVGGKKYWGKTDKIRALRIGNHEQTRSWFRQLWSADSINNVFETDSFSLMQFLCLQSIVINETGGSLMPVPEKVGTTGHPGIAYAFDKITGLKRSYNTLKGNLTCLTLFNNTDYNNAFGSLPLAEQLMNTADKVWKGDAYPQTYPTKPDPSVNGYVLEADFFKFRGRGYIQTTGRSQYKAMVNFVMRYTGDNGCIKNAQINWSARSSDIETLATVSSNNEWDDLFQNSGGVILAKGIMIHNKLAGNYLQLLNETTPAGVSKKIKSMGKKISGGEAYAALFLNRVTQIIEAM